MFAAAQAAQKNAGAIFGHKKPFAAAQAAQKQIRRLA